MAHTAIRSASPISQNEFLQMFQKCKPSIGWPSKVAVANSGGPDSTCLLFLTDRLLSDKKMKGEGLPASVVSITVDHGLQATSSSMASHCSQTATKFDVEHLTIPIPWSEPPYPIRPTGSKDFENIARSARFHALFQGMTQMAVSTIAFGHHADDQVETCLMRLGKGSSELGAGGMAHCRKWGMGLGRSTEGRLGWAGYEGMRRWVVRPLLEVSKDRILATCEANGLGYVTDVTNFQPDVTLRNAIRQMLREEAGGNWPASDISPDVNEELKKIRIAAESSQSLPIDFSAGQDQMRRVANALSARAIDIDNEVDRHLKRRTIPSPISTFTLSTHNLQAIADPSVRAAMVMRILRYVSPQPWGSVRADGNRRKDSIQRLIESIWAPSGDTPPPFLVVGSGVIWRSAWVYEGYSDRPSRLLVPKSKDSWIKRRREGDRLAWLASRQPPLEKRVRHNPDGSLLEDPLHMDLTELLSKARHDARKVKHGLEVLYDCRFLIRFDIAKMPSEIGMSLSVGRSKVVVEARTRWFYPQVLWRRPGRDDEHLGVVMDENNRQVMEQRLNLDKKRTEWINIEFIRTMDAR